MKLFQTSAQYLNHQLVHVDEVVCMPDETYPNSAVYCYHDFFEAELFLEAEGTHYINAIPYSVRPGYFFLLFPGDYHAYSLSPNHFMRMYNIKFHRNLVNPSIMALLRSRQYPMSLILDEGTITKIQQEIEILRECTDICEENRYLRKNTMERIVLYLLQILRSESTPAKEVEKDTRVFAIVDYIEKHYAETIDLSVLADVAGVSEKYFGIFFKRNTKMCFTEYLTRVRLAHAMTLLEDTQLRIKEIAAAVGFHSQEYMAQQFMKYCETTPTLYRSSHRNAHSPTPETSLSERLDSQ